MIVDCYNKRINISSTIILVIEDILKLSQGLNIYECRCHIYREANRTVDYLTKKELAIELP